MKFTNITPPVETIFNIELTENELKLLLCIVGNVDVETLERLTKEDFNIVDVISDINFTDKFYSGGLKMLD